MPPPAPATAADALAEGQRHHGAGAFDAAENAYVQALEIDPDNADALHLLGITHFQTGRQDSALELVDAAIDAAPDTALYRYTKGVVLQQLNRRDEAVEAYRAATERNPSHLESRFNMGVALAELGRTDEAAGAFRAAIDLSGGHVPSLIYLGNLETERRRFEEALALYRKVCDLTPDDGRAHHNAANVLVELLRLEEAAAAARRAAELSPGNADIQATLGRALQAVGDIDGAAAAYAVCHRLRRQAAESEPGAPSFSESTPAKIKHDIEQIDYLKSRNLITLDQSIIDGYSDIASSIPANCPPGERLSLTDGQRRRIAPYYNRPYHVADAPMIEAGAINPDLDTEAITRDYFSNEPGACFFDNFLRPEALAELRRFCLESTIWYDFSHTHGYLGAYREDGFAAPLIMQIAEDLRHALPDVIKGLPVRHLWAYKYDSNMEGIATHADFAAVNVNFWITPDEANLDPDSGGLVVHKAECPLDWTFDDYNSADKTRVNAFIEENSRGTIVVPHRQNRVVMFNSDLFHATDTIRFREGYENRRINVTILYGERHYETG